MTILICDDEIHIRAILGTKLRSAGHTVFEASDGDRGFAIAQHNSPAVIVSDFQMPGGDGLTMATRLHATVWGRTIPIVLLTARGHTLDEGVLRATNIRTIIDKPFSAREVLSVVERLEREEGSRGTNAVAA
ncbi:MAG: response regulator [Planctomycetota bacterium]